MARMEFRDFETGETRPRCVHSNQGPRLLPAPALFLLLMVSIIFPDVCRAQVEYVARFTQEKQKYLQGEPIFCTFTLQNTGARTFAFSYRPPERVLNRELEQEPHFAVSDRTRRALPDPAPKPCGGAKGSVVYGSVTLPPGQTHTERWLLNQWARFSSPGSYHVRAERRLPLLELNPATQKFSSQPIAYALAMNELSFEIMPSTAAQLETVFRPYVKLLEGSATSDPTEAVLVLTTLPQPFFLGKLETIANAKEQRWDRRQALEGLARLGTRAAWDVIGRTARGEHLAGKSTVRSTKLSGDETLRAYAVLLLGEKGDTSYLPAMLQMVSTASEELRGDVLRTLGFFHDPRANQILFERLHSAKLNDRVNSILGLKNLESRDAVPALLAMLDDPAVQVRQVANFALQSLTGRRFKLSSTASRTESARVAKQWHAWWREHGASFAPVRQPACQDW